MIVLGIILFLFVMLVIPARANSEEKEKLVKQIDVRVKVYSDKNVFPSPPISLTLRMTAPNLVEKVETIYFSALDYQFLSLRTLRYAKYFLDKGDMPKANKYIEKADRYYRLATSLQRDSLTVLQSTISAAEWMVVYKASRTALGFTATGLGVASSTLFDIGTLYTDYLLDTSVMPIKKAKKNLIAKAISGALLRFTGASDLIGDAVKHGWGSSRAFPILQKIMGSSDFKDAVLKEFMRLGGDVGDYVARKTIEEALERIIRGTITPSFSKDEPIVESKTVYDVIEKDDKRSQANTGTEKQSKDLSPEDKNKFSAKQLDNGVIFDDDFSVAIVKIQRYPTKTIIWLAFRKISEDWRPVRKKLRLRIIDYRQNKYETYFEINGGIFSLKGEPPDLGDLPPGFTWITWVEIRKIPEIAPIAKIEIENFDLDFKKPKLPDLGFEIKPEQLLSPGEEIQMDKHLSFQVGNLLVKDEFPGSFGREKEFDITLPLMVRNNDYNARSMAKLVIGALLEDGRFIPPSTRGWEGPEIQALSTENYNIRICIGFEKDLGGVISIPHLLLLYKYPFPTTGYQFYRFVPISPELKHRCLEIKNSHLVLESAKAKLDRWCSENMSHLRGFQINDYAIVGRNIWAIGSRPVYTGPARVIHSSDGGNSWNVLWKHDKMVLKKVHFLNEEEGLIATKTTILETSDGGRTWNVLLTVGHIPVLAIARIEDFVVEGNKSTSVRLTGWMGEVIKTTDGGKTWYLVGRGGPKLRTQDGGKTWQKVEATESTPVEVPSPTPTKEKEPDKQMEKQMEKTVKSLLDRLLKKKR